MPPEIIFDSTLLKGRLVVLRHAPEPGPTAIELAAAEIDAQNQARDIHEIAFPVQQVRVPKRMAWLLGSEEDIRHAAMETTYNRMQWMKLWFTCMFDSLADGVSLREVRYPGRRNVVG